MTDPDLTFDLNSDIGEGFGAWTMGEDDALLELVTSANIACGYHAGDATIMRRTTEVAASRGVRIGAHVSYRDLAGFGRRTIDVPAAQVRDDSLYQIAALAAFAVAAGDRVRYVKPHGALYHVASADPEIAEALARAAATFDPDLALLGPAGSAMADAARSAGLTFHPEGFADRAYLASGALAPRSVAGSVLSEAAAREQAVSIATAAVAPVLGSDEPLPATVTVTARSLCVHSDSPGAVAIARAVREALANAGVRLEAFT